MSLLTSPLRVSIPPATRASLLLLVFLSGLSAIERFSLYHKDSQEHPEAAAGRNPADYVMPWLRLVPHSAFTHPWVFFTTSFVETTLPGFCFTAAVFFYGFRYCEHTWGSAETVKFIAIVSGISNLSAMFAVLLAAVLFQRPEWAAFPINGGFGLHLALFVVCKQLLAEHNLKLFRGIVKFRLKRLVVIFLAYYTILSIVLKQILYITLALAGFYTAWVYLRFFQTSYAVPMLGPSPSGSGATIVRGDASDTFSLVSFFPNAISPFLEPIFNAGYRFAVLIGLIEPFQDGEVAEGNLRAEARLNSQQRAGQSNLSAAERRRAVALRVLEERMAVDEAKNQESTILSVQPDSERPEQEAGPSGES